LTRICKCSARNFSLTATSHAIDAGVDLGLAKNGSAPDRGAFETMVFPSCSVEDGLPNTVPVYFESNVAPPVSVTDATRMTIHVASLDRFESASTVVSSNRRDVTIDGAAVSKGQTVAFGYVTTGNVLNLALLGGTLNQRLNAVGTQSRRR
jgi:hypothetical protein